MEADLPFGERLERWLTHQGVRQSTLAHALKVSPPTVNAWLSGRESPRSDRLPSIAAALKMTLSQFFGPLPEVTPLARPNLPKEQTKAPPRHPFTGEDTRETDMNRVLAGGDK
jgi:transcriptional regulator with XRE-family HTH domain